MSIVKTFIFMRIFLQVYSSLNEIEVFVVPHFHMDAGWLLTIDEYFNLEVDWILTSVIQQMDEQPHYKFTHGDIY